MPEAPYGRSSKWLTVIMITPEEFGADRESVRLALEAENIETRLLWKPMHMQPLFAVATDSSGLMADSKRRERYPARVIGKENLGIQEFRH